jgi:nitroimidazol reductase NimA-like FMN-containing flavoprotein (pyridoxamine 5'-phosphate oxidase superfamily)
MLEKMKSLAREKDICVLATVSNKKPHCSLMAYVTDDECREIYMVSHKQTRKYKNLLENPSASLLIDTREENLGTSRPEAKALTVAGVVQQLDDEDKKSLIRTKFLDRHPHMEEFVSHPDAEILCIKVTSFLLLNGLTDAHFETI